MFWLARLIKFARPIPPTPIPATFSKSLGGVMPLPNTCRGTILRPAPATAASFTNSRRVIPRLLLIVFPRAPSCSAKLHRLFLLTQPNVVTNNLSIIFQRESQNLHVHSYVRISIEARRHRSPAGSHDSRNQCARKPYSQRS